MENENDGELKVEIIGNEDGEDEEQPEAKKWACARLEWLVRAHIHSERKHIIVHCTLIREDWPRPKLECHAV